MQTFQGRLPSGWALRLTADRPHRYTIEFMATGAEVKFVMLAGQSCTIKDGGSDLNITMDDIEAPKGGLQLVPAVATSN